MILAIILTWLCLIVISLEPFNNCKIFDFSDILRLDCFIYTETLLFLCSTVLFNCILLYSQLQNNSSGICFLFFFFLKQFSIDIVEKTPLWNKTRL